MVFAGLAVGTLAARRSANPRKCARVRVRTPAAAWASRVSSRRAAIFVQCASEDEISTLYAALREEGTELMPLSDYGFSARFGWVNDRFGVSWQLNLPA